MKTNNNLTKLKERKKEILPLTISYLRRHRTASIVEAIKLKLISIKPSLLIDLNDYLYA